MKYLFIFILVCRVFSWGPEGANGITPEINQWLRDKKIVSVSQTTSTHPHEMTYLTIIAENYE
jgi:hypothetical protein